MSKNVVPSLGGSSFSCPHCGALAHQYWYRSWIDSFKKGEMPQIFDYSGVNHEGIEKIENEDERSRVSAFVERLSKNRLTYRNVKTSPYSTAEMMNFAYSNCHSCGGFSVWISGSIAYPTSNGDHLPREDMPPDAKIDFKEAAEIFGKSPRGAAALLRLAIQKLMPALGQKGENLVVSQFEV